MRNVEYRASRQYKGFFTSANATTRTTVTRNKDCAFMNALCQLFDDRLKFEDKRIMLSLLSQAHYIIVPFRVCLGFFKLLVIETFQCYSRL
jgi:hypothetical protein